MGTHWRFFVGIAFCAAPALADLPPPPSAGINSLYPLGLSVIGFIGILVVVGRRGARRSKLAAQRDEAQHTPGDAWQPTRVRRSHTRGLVIGAVCVLLSISSFLLIGFVDQHRYEARFESLSNFAYGSLMVAPILFIAGIAIIIAALVASHRESKR